MSVSERKEALKRRLPGLVNAVRALGRFRFLLKARRVRSEGRPFREDPLSALRFVLFDPETHSYTYELANTAELAEFLERATGVSAPEIAGYIDEARDDPELGQGLRRRVRWRVDTKRHLPLGNRLLWYALVRAVKPGLVVETGIYQGLGSLALLRALDRNAAEGVEGRLISLDLDPDSGWLVPETLRARWRQVVGDVESVLEDELAGEQLDVFIHESDHNEELQRLEFGAALAHAADELYVIDSSGTELPVLREICAGLRGWHQVFVERPLRHFYSPVGTAVARFGTPPSGRLARTSEERISSTQRG